jgi:transcriptional regulator with XRE-family HTH domain
MKIMTPTHTPVPLRRLRVERGLSQFGLAIRSRVNPTIISAAENGRLRLGPRQLRRLARALGVDVAALLKDPCA